MECLLIEVLGCSTKAVSLVQGIYAVVDGSPDPRPKPLSALHLPVVSHDLVVASSGQHAMEFESPT
jgi:hypothetical protein